MQTRYVSLHDYLFNDGSSGVATLNLIFALITVFAPLLSALLIAPFTRVMSSKMAHIISCSLVVLSAIVSGFLIYDIVVNNNAPIYIHLWSWFGSDTINANFSIYIDSLTAAMIAIVPFISALVHIYSVGYMHEDDHQPRFMAYLSLFTFFMLILVVSDNFLQLFLGWEGVGLSSYLLIGFWYKKESANVAAIKAFLVNRVGDIGLALGIFVIFITFNSVNFIEVFAQITQTLDKNISFFNFEINAITLSCALLFIGCMGKSAQIGLHVWLPDAMEGPTPVSALIHAATMVTAGVFLVIRCSPMFEYAPSVLGFMVIIGAITAILAASIALVQNDIKKIIAYSTCSQLGYMFFACGVSAYAAGIFHLVTHAFFKALLFLSAGSVIHAMSGQQDIQKMGGIWRKIPFTYVVMFIGSLALAGLPPLSGFFSKDAILEASYAKNTGVGYFAYYIGIIVAVLTAFYSWRLLILTFHGKTKASKKVYDHIHESPFSMKIPLAILTFGSIFVGVIGEKLLHILDPEGKIWNGAIFVLEKNNTLEKIHNIPWIVGYIPTVCAVIGILSAYAIYKFKIQILVKLCTICKICKNTLEHKYYFDEIYDYLISKIKILAKCLWKYVDEYVIDGVPNGIASAVYYMSSIVSKCHTGYVYNYTFATLISLLILLYFI